jgi:hypothetical protein
MFPRVSPIIFLAVVAAVLTTNALAQITVAQDGSGDFNGSDEKPIIAAIARVHEKGGGEIVIHPGVYAVQRSIELKAVQNVTLRGLPGAVLKLPPLQYAEVSRDVAVGETVLPVRVQQGITADVLLQIRAPGAIDAFSGKAKPTFYVKLSKVEVDRLILAEPLKFPVPAKTHVVNENAPNLFELRNLSEGITIEGLTIDGGRTPDAPPIPAHAQRCGIFASGLYNYTDGPTGKPVRGITIRDCTIRNCFGRGIAFYSVIDALVVNCRIEDNVDEAIDLDHFTVNCRVLDNQVARCRVGVELNDANECWVARNRFEACQTGVIIWRWCKMDDLNVRNHVLDNLFLNISGNGLQFQAGTSGNIARGNIIRGAGRNGVSLGASDTIIAGNIIERPGMYGIVTAGDRNDIVENRVVDAGTGAAQPYAGIRILGANNRVLDNFVSAGADAKARSQPVVDEGKENTVR